MNADYRNAPQGHGSISLSDGSIFTLDPYPSTELNDRYIDCHLTPACSICSQLHAYWHTCSHWTSKLGSRLMQHKT
ncbi:MULTISPECIES: hypothetical protein [Deefgea]|uniref:Uncharacterized protein n=1 Tax=Deefgea chitinilytica TaxID=570276 RepID=A0ABS2C9Z9_9NEIS|nr:MULTISPECIES: hypothetical protein [Deefgea]MBM5570201.1 hypothetical protein [Deefgea chitinilytica]MBM9887430.1 hypothetical protein [Deefgea sp. CFH1-16]